MQWNTYDQMNAAGVGVEAYPVVFNLESSGPTEPATRCTKQTDCVRHALVKRIARRLKSVISLSREVIQWGGIHCREQGFM